MITRQLTYMFLLLLIIYNSCNKIESTADHWTNISFSNDSVTSDTIFSDFGSVSKQFKIYNNKNEYIKITSAFPEGGTSSKYKININWISQYEFRNIVIPENDSIGKGDYDIRLDALLPVIDAGSIPIVNQNIFQEYYIEGKRRTSDGKPDLGVFEYKV